MTNCTVNYYDMNVDGLIQDFHVVEKYRGVGLGTGLLEKVEEVAKEKGIKIIHGLVQDKNDALQFWKKSGFAKFPSSKGWNVVKRISK